MLVNILLVNHIQSENLIVLIGNTTNTQADAQWDVVGDIGRRDYGSGTLLHFNTSRVLQFVLIKVNFRTVMAVCEVQVYKTGK